MFDQGSNQVSCGHCHWRGALEVVAIELVNDNVAHRCPSCQKPLCIPERLSPRRRSNERFVSDFDALGGSSFSSIRIPPE